MYWRLYSIVYNILGFVAEWMWCGCSSSPLPYLRLQSAVASDQMEMSQDICTLLTYWHTSRNVTYVLCHSQCPHSKHYNTRCLAPVIPSASPALGLPWALAASGSWGCCYQLVKFFVFTSPHRYNNTAGDGGRNGDTGVTFTVIKNIYSKIDY